MDVWSDGQVPGGEWVVEFFSLSLLSVISASGLKGFGPTGMHLHIHTHTNTHYHAYLHTCYNYVHMHTLLSLPPSLQEHCVQLWS